MFYFQLNHEYILWIALFAGALHIFEEIVLNWKAWVESVSGLTNIQWTDFYFANAAFLIGGFCMAMVGWQAPWFSLILPAILLINGLVFHILPTLYLRRLSPGVITSILLFLPIGIWAYWGAWEDGVLSWADGIFSFIFGLILMLLPFLVFKYKDLLHIQRDGKANDSDKNQ